MHRTVSTALILALAMSVLAIRPARADDAASLPPALQSFDLGSFSDLGVRFEQETGKVRLVALLSASCGYCIKGYRYMRKLLDEIDDPRLAMFVVWEPMLSGDTRALSLKMAKKEPDPRMVYQAWDEARITGDTWTRVMQAGDERWLADSTVWDVYFLYDAGAHWSGPEPTRPSEPTVPAYWQHQGAGTRELALDYGKLKHEIEHRLAALGPLPADGAGR